jgi:dienelactone hydrolase
MTAMPVPSKSGRQRFGLGPALGHAEGYICAMLQSRDVRYTADDTLMAGCLILPEAGGRRPAVLIFHEAGGVTDHELDSARRLAELGYVAFAVDYHGGARPDSDTKMMARLEYLAASPARMRAIGRAALEIVAAEPHADPARIAAIGYCFGAVMALELARDHADLKAVVGFHPGWADHDPQDSRNITGKVLLCIGSEDPWMPPEQRLALEEEMRAAGVDWQLNLYGGAKHSFTNPSAAHSPIAAVDYHEPSDGRSWQAMLGLFDAIFAE